MPLNGGIFVRSVADSNCCPRFCRPIPNHSGNRPGAFDKWCCLSPEIWGICETRVQRYNIFLKYANIFAKKCKIFAYSCYSLLVKVSIARFVMSSSRSKSGKKPLSPIISRTIYPFTMRTSS